MNFKKETLLFIFAGFILGSVVTFVVIKTLEKKNAPLPQQEVSQTIPSKSPSVDSISADEHFEMMQNFIKSAKENPDDIKSRITLGNIYYENGKFKEAIMWYEEAYKIDPQNTDLLVDIGACYRAEDPKKAIEYFDKALAIDPQKQQALYNKVIVFLFDLNDIKSAKESFKKLEEKYPNLPMIEQLREELKKAETEK